jgi:hypothetical protein
MALHHFWFQRRHPQNLTKDFPSHAINLQERHGVIPADPNKVPLLVQLERLCKSDFWYLHVGQGEAADYRAGSQVVVP